MYGDERIAPDKFDNFDDDSTYFPERPEGTSVVVSVSAPFFSHRVKDSRFNEDRVAILPAGEPLPSFAKNGVPDREVRYRLHGFINPDDKLVTHHAPTTYARQAVDWSVANAVAQNAVEKALLVDAIDPSSLLGMLSVDAGIAAYLKYYGEKHGGSYVPQEEPRSELPPLTNKEFKIYQDLAALALSSRQ
jgi:hypothetical protein